MELVVHLVFREWFDSSVIMPFSWCVVAVTLPIKCRSTFSFKPQYIHFRCVAGIHGGCLRTASVNSGRVESIKIFHLKIA